MNRFWEENRPIITTVLAALALFGVTHMLLVGNANAELERLKTRREKLEKDLAKDRPPAGVGIKPLMDFLKQDSERLRKNKKQLKQALEAAFPKWTEERGANYTRWADWFAARHSQLRDELTRQCTNSMVGISEQMKALGFPPKVIEIMDEPSARENLKKLALVEKLVLLLVKAEVSRIESITPEDTKTTGAIRTDDKQLSETREVEYYDKFIEEYPIRIVVVTPINELMRFLDSVRESDQFLMIRNVTILNRHHKGLTSSEGGPHALGDDEVQVTIEAAGMRFLSDEEVQEQRKSGGSPSRTPGRRERDGPVMPIGG